MASQAVKKFSCVIKNFSSLRSEYYVSSRKFGVACCKCNLDASKETSSVKGSMNVDEFLLLPSQMKFVNRLLEIQPEIASNVRIKSPFLKKAYMNVLLSLTETVRKPFEEISKNDLSDAYAALESMTCVGFKLDWLKKKLNEVSKKKVLSKYPLASKIIVKNLPISTSEGFLRKEFSAFGEITEVMIIKDRPMKRSICYAFIQFTSQEDAFLAVEFMDRRKYSGWKIYVDTVKPRNIYMLQKAAKDKVKESLLEMEKAEYLAATATDPISYSYDDVFFDDLTY